MNLSATVVADLEFNHYTSLGNLFYLGGNSDFGPYLGFTWGFENLHVGFVTSPFILLFPLPYIYWRF